MRPSPASPARRVTSITAALVAALVATEALAATSGDAALDAALAQVVDSPLMPEEAAALEGVPYRALLDRLRVGPDERTLNAMSVLLAGASGDPFTHRTLVERPDEHRGQIVFATGVVAQIDLVTAGGVGRLDDCEVYAGVMGVFRLAADKRSARIQPWAFRALRRPGDGRLYVGDRVTVSGYFFKTVPLVDASGAVNRMPLVVCPWPTVVGFWPASMVRRYGAGLVPVREFPHEEIRRRPVVDFLDGAAVTLNGVALERATVAAALRRFAERHPSRAIVARAGGDADRAEAEAWLASAGVASEDIAWKELASE
jgi:hypothetical protein